MARLSTQVNEKEKPTPYDEYFDGNTWESERGEDYCRPTLFEIRRLRHFADKKNFKIVVSEWDENHFKFFAIPRR